MNDNEWVFWIHSERVVFYDIWFFSFKALADLSATSANSQQFCDYFISCFPLEAHNTAAFESGGSEASFTVSLHFLHNSFVALKPIHFSGSSLAAPQLRLSWRMYACLTDSQCKIAKLWRDCGFIGSSRDGSKTYVHQLSSAKTPGWFGLSPDCCSARPQALIQINAS